MDDKKEKSASWLMAKINLIIIFALLLYSLAFYSYVNFAKLAKAGLALALSLIPVYIISFFLAGPIFIGIFFGIGEILLKKKKNFTFKGLIINLALGLIWIILYIFLTTRP